MPATAQAMRLDPWAAEYEGSIQIGDDIEPASVDVKVEQDEWRAVRPGARKAAPRMAFVDGVRRIEHRVLVGEANRTVFCLLGSFGVAPFMWTARPKSATKPSAACSSPAAA